MIRKLLLGLVVLLILAAIGFFGFGPGIVERGMNKVVATTLPTVTPQTQALHNQLQVVDLHGDTLLWKRHLDQPAGRGQIDLPRLLAGNVALQIFSSVTKTPPRPELRCQRPRHRQYHAARLRPAPAGADLDFAAPALALACRKAQPRRRRLQRPAAGDPHARRARAPTRRPRSRGKGRRRHALGRGAAEYRGQARQSRHAPRRRLPHGRAGALLRQRSRRVDAWPQEGRSHPARPPGRPPHGSARHDRRHCPFQPPDRGRSAGDGAAPGRLQPWRRPGDVQGQPQPHRRRDPRRRPHRRRDRYRLLGRGSLLVAPAEIARAIAHVRDLVGVDYVGLGSDFDGSVTTGFDTAQLAVVTQALVDKGFTPADIRKVMGGNALRVLRMGIVPQP